VLSVLHATAEQAPHHQRQKLLAVIFKASVPQIRACTALLGNMVQAVVLFVQIRNVRRAQRPGRVLLIPRKSAASAELDSSLLVAPRCVLPRPA
jgi:hypothetical protein